MRLAMLTLLLALLLAAPPAFAGEIVTCEKADGYRGIWYFNQPSGDEYKYKYSGGLGTYPQQLIPFAVYAPEAKKTFFCWGGRPKDENRLVHMVAWFDHATGTVPRPRILMDKGTRDAHDNPTILLGPGGHVFILSSAHGTARPAYIHRSVEPYRVDRFQRVLVKNFSYAQAWRVPEEGILFLHTRYAGPRRFLYWVTSPDGVRWPGWEEPKRLARIDHGHYQVSARRGGTVATAFNYHPRGKGLNARTNLYYLATDDFGRTWRNAAGEAVEVPLTTTEEAAPALVHDWEADGLLVYLKTVQFDAGGRPVLLLLTSRGYASGPKNAPRTWRTARWTGTGWTIRPVTPSDHNYDFGPLYIEPDGTWRLIAPTETGPQPYNTGGEVAMWTSRDQGATWKKVRPLTRGSEFNHTYVRRPVDAHPDFYALWADGHGRHESPSRLYFTNRAGDHVWRLPTEMTGETAKPEVVW